jgi:hypothetical protein
MGAHVDNRKPALFTEHDKLVIVMCRKIGNNNLKARAATWPVDKQTRAKSWRGTS